MPRGRPSKPSKPQHLSQTARERAIERRMEAAEKENKPRTVLVPWYGVEEPLQISKSCRVS